MPPFVAFHSEWLILSGGLASGHPVLAYLEFLVPLFTAGYALWLAVRLALGPTPEGLQVGPTSTAMRWSLYALVIAALGIGLHPNALYHWAGDAAARETTFTARVAGAYKIQLAVSDGERITYSQICTVEVTVAGTVFSLR